MRISITPEPSLGTVGSGFGQEPDGTHIQKLGAGATTFGIRVPVIN